LLLRLALGLFALAIPLFALWLMTSVVLYAGAPLWAALAVGAVVVVGLPFVWDMWAESRFLRRQNPPPRILTRADRIRLRVLVVCVSVSAFFVVAVAKPTTNALAQQGDWILFGASGPFANDVRGGIGGVAKGLAGLTGNVPEGAGAGAVAGGQIGEVGQVGSAGQVGQVGEPSPNEAGVPGPGAGGVTRLVGPDGVVIEMPDDPVVTRPAKSPQPPVMRAGDAPNWPLPVEPHPVVRAMRDDVPSIAAVAELIKSRETNPYQRVKAIHDFVVQWVAYDGRAIDPKYTPPAQDAESVFVRRVGTCDGYTNLMVALGKLTGDEMVPILGRSRADGVGLDGFYHSWVGATIEGKPYLIDPTWNAGQVFGLEFRARYSTSYLFTPPEIFAYDHLPNDPAWSLTDPPLTMDRFLARPVISAHFFAWGMEMVGVERAVTEVTSGRFDFRINNPRGAWVLVVAMPLGDGRPFNCVVPSQANPVEVGCKLSAGAWKLDVYANSTAGGRFPLMASLRVDSK
jgi:hypothetical protein